MIISNVKHRYILEENKHIVNLELRDITLVSTNEMYTPIAVKRGSLAGRLIQSKKLQKGKEIVSCRLRSLEKFKDIMNTISEFLSNFPNYALKLSFVFYVTEKQFFTKDTSNYIKFIEDVLSNELKIDDCRNIKIEAEKEALDEKEKENVGFYVQIETFKLEKEFKKYPWKELKRKGK